MDRNDRKAISELFERLAEVERRTPSGDPEAERDAQAAEAPLEDASGLGGTDFGNDIEP